MKVKWSRLAPFFCVGFLAAISLAFQNCSSGGGGAAGGSGDWYYHWNCHGDSQCLANNPSGTATGNLDEGPAEASCTSLLTFAMHFWGSAATDSCDQSSTGGGGTNPKTDNVFAILNPTATYWLCDPTGTPFNLTLTSTGAGVGTGFYQKATSPPSLISSFTWTEGTDLASWTANAGAAYPDMIEISPNVIPNPTAFTYINGAIGCSLKSGTLPGVPTDLANGYISQGGLTWMPNNIIAARSWSSANTYCTTSTINGTTGWRLPTDAELLQFFESGAVTAAEQSNGWGSVSLGGGAVLTWASDAAAAGSHMSSSELELLADTQLDSTLLQVTCVQ